VTKDNIHTGGGTYITDAVQVESGDFIGRDQVTHIHQDSKPAPGTPPYRGLRFFDVEDAHRFFGREALTAELVEQLRTQSILAVVGASGSGKSSLLRAGIASAIESGKTLAGGVLPPLGSYQWPIHIMTPTTHPLETLARTLVDIEEPEQNLAQATQLLAQLRQDPTALHRHIVASLAQTNKTNPGHRLLLMVDQFEEIFTLCQDQTERQAFVDNLIYATLDAPANESNVIIIIALRADFYANCAAFPNLRAALEQYQRYIGPMTITELQRAIEEPASRGGWDLEAGLVDLLLDDVEDAPGALPLLSHALLETWKRRSGRMLTIAGYLESGRVSGAIAYTAETVYQQFNLQQQTIARNIFLRLTEVGDSPASQYTRRRARMDEIIATDDDTLDVGQVLRKLVAARLVTTSQDERFLSEEVRHTYVEVAHEALLREWPTLQNWLSDNREGLRVQHRLSEDSQEWQRMERDGGLLYRGARLQQAVEWLVQRPAQLNELEQNFLDQSQSEAQRVVNLAEELRQQELNQQRALTRAAEAQQRAELARAQEAEARALEQTAASQRLRRRAWLLGAAACVALLLVGSSLYLLNILQEERDELQIVNKDLEDKNHKLIVAEEKLQASNDELAREFARAEAEKDAAQEQRRIAESNQRLLQSESLAAEAQQILKQGDETGNRALKKAIQAVTTTLEIDGFVRISADAALRSAVNQAFWQQTIAGAGNGVAFSPDGDQLVTHSTTQTNTAWIWDVENQQVIQELRGVPDRLDAVAYHPDGTQLMLLGEGGVTETLQLWDTATWQRIEPLPTFTQTIQSAIYNPYGTAIAAATTDDQIHIFDLESGVSTATLAQEDIGRVNAMQNGQLGRVLSGHTASVKTVAFSPNNAYVASGSSDRTIRIWNTQTGKLVHILRGHTRPVQRVISFTPCRVMKSRLRP